MISGHSIKRAIERRRHRRYIVRGRVRFMLDSLEVWGDLVNFGQGGLLIRSRFEIPAGTRLDIRVMAFCFPSAVDGIGEVVGGRGELLALQYLEKSSEADDLLRWLEQEHCPWTGTFDDPSVEFIQPTMAEEETPEMGEKAQISKLEEYIFQNA
jgi:hypothetical protein